MKKLFLTLTVLAIIGTSLAAQGKFYYSDNGKISVKEDASTFIIHTTSEEPLKNLDTDRKFAGIEKVEAFSHKKYAIVQSKAGSNITKSNVANLIGLDNGVRDISAGLRLDDGFTIYPTHKIVFKPKSKNNIEAVNQVLSSFEKANTEIQYGIYRIELIHADDALAAANAIYESGLVEFAHPDFYAPKQHNNDPLFNQQFQMHNTGQTIDGVPGTADMDCNALEAWGVTLGSNNITVAIIDDGLENHEDLNDGNGASRFIAGFTPANNGNGGTTSSSDHGVACAGIVAASHNNIGVQGVAPLVKLLSVNIFFGGESTQDIADGITWAKNNGADVMSNSWGYTSCTANFSNINNAIADANSNGRGGLGSVIVFASGNGYKTCVDFPANNPNVIAVGAFTNQGVKSTYSNAGPSLDIAAPSNAVGSQPGAGVRTTDRMGGSGYSSSNYTTSFGGTSAACPVVAGVAALVLGYNSGLTSSQVKNILYSTATDMGSPGFDNEYGNGRVNAFGALQAAGGNPPTCTDGIQNGQETGVDCGGPDCPACPSNCSDNELTLSITLDNYPGETSWALVNSSGQTVASGGTYGGSPNGSTITEDICVPDGCYDFTINDSYGDGICCAYGNGSYTLSDGANVLASGGAFGSSETTNFCLGGGGPDTQAPSTPTNLISSNTTQTSTDLSWNASSDNVGVEGYNVYIDGSLLGSVTGTGATITGLVSSTTYTMSVEAFDAAGNVSGAASTSVTTLDPPSGPTTIFAHYFETGFDGWADGGGDCARYSGSRSWEGTYSIRLRDNSGTRSSMTSPSYDLSSYSSVELKFYFYPNSMENGEDFWVRYNDGSGWQTIATYASGSSFQNGSFYSATVTLDDASFNLSSNAQFRIQCDASGNGDQVYIDEVTLVGTSAGATLADTPQSGISVESGLLNIGKDLEELLISPNPTANFVTVQSTDEIQRINVIALDGRVLQSMNIIENQIDVDLSAYEAGMYILQIHTVEEVISETVIKY